MKAIQNNEFYLQTITIIAKDSIYYMQLLETGNTNFERDSLSAEFIDNTHKLARFINISNLNDIKIAENSLKTYADCKAYTIKVAEFLCL